MIASDREPAIVDLGVMASADRDEIAQVGRSACFPVVEVMHVAPLEGGIASGYGATAIAGVQGQPLAGGGEASAATQIEHLAIGAKHSGDDPALAGEFASGFR